MPLSPVPDVFARRDPLGEALQFLRMSGALYVSSEATAPWALAIPSLADCLMFHVLIAGDCTVEAEGEARALRPGDFVLVPHGAGHVLRGSPSARASQLFDLPHDYVSAHFANLRFGGTSGKLGATARMICGVVRSDFPGARHILATLPAIVSVGGAQGAELTWLENTIRFMADEAREPRPGGESLLDRLAEIIVIQAIRNWLMSESAPQVGLFAALRDRQIGIALAAFHRSPERPWTLALLARSAMMSRSAFAARFTELVGESTMQYVTRWRMYVAHAALQENAASLAAIASRVGYRSEAAFSRAFKRVIGAAPGAVRREQLPLSMHSLSSALA